MADQELAVTPEIIENGHASSMADKAAAARERARKAAESLKEKAAETAHVVRERAHEVAEKATHQAQEAWEVVSDTSLRDVEAATTKYVRAHPGRSLLMAAGVGLVAGLLIAGRRR
ncbi:MAG: DUF883 domain-containing protein [Candidatus Sumerlaeia bacterium]|nr:DUF883 domain-containing protein [Candidatus Sumerlaeia bacterium]